MKTIVYLAILSFLFNACNKDFKSQKIDSDLLVSAQKLNEDISLNAETEKRYPSAGYQITFSEKVRKNEIYIEFKKVNVPKVGLTVLEPATCSINLGNLENGEYNVTFELDRKKTKGKLIVGPTTVLNLDAGGNVKLK